MKPSSAKAKGRALATKVAGWLRSMGGFSDADVRVTPSGVNGPDVQLADAARAFWPFAIECKKYATFAVYQHYDQAVATAKGAEPIVVIEGNRRKPLVVVDAEFFFRNWALLETTR